jgi:hypothetical protein
LGRHAVFEVPDELLLLGGDLNAYLATVLIFDDINAN